MPKYLVIVESPAKSKTIENYLGEDYIVTSSKGHIRDLTTRGLGGYGVDIENNFEPQYKIMKDKHETVRELKALVKKSDKVYLATDPDREGEAISWHLYQTLGLEKKEYERIVFHEITKSAVASAMKNGRDINLDLVKSQESRRIVDRIIGFSLSKLLQKKIGSKSAGRVQSVALKLIVDREKEISDFDKQEYWDILIQFSKKAKKLKAKLEKYNNEKVEIKSEKEALEIEAKLNKEYIVESIIKKEKEKAPKPPFITSTLQQDASNKYNFNARKTMQIAQKLYEGIELGKERVGLITYMTFLLVVLWSPSCPFGRSGVLWFRGFGRPRFRLYSFVASRRRSWSRAWPSSQRSCASARSAASLATSAYSLAAMTALWASSLWLAIAASSAIQAALAASVAWCLALWAFRSRRASLAAAASFLARSVQICVALVAVSRYFCSVFMCCVLSVMVPVGASLPFLILILLPFVFFVYTFFGFFCLFLCRPVEMWKTLGRPLLAPVAAPIMCDVRFLAFFWVWVRGSVKWPFGPVSAHLGRFRFGAHRSPASWCFLAMVWAVPGSVVGRSRYLRFCPLSVAATVIS